MGLDDNDDLVRLPDTARLNLRERLIRWLARGDAVVLNVIIVAPKGFAYGKRDLDAGSLAANVLFVLRDDYELVPGTVVGYRDG